MATDDKIVKVDLKYVGSDFGGADYFGAMGTALYIEVNSKSVWGQQREFVFHPGATDPQGAARIDGEKDITGEKYPNEDIGFVPAPDVWHHFTFTFRSSGGHTWLITDGVNPSLEWSKDFTMGGSIIQDIKVSPVKAFAFNNEHGDELTPGVEVSVENAGMHYFMMVKNDFLNETSDALAPDAIAA